MSSSIDHFWPRLDPYQPMESQVSNGLQTLEKIDLLRPNHDPLIFKQVCLWNRSQSVFGSEGPGQEKLLNSVPRTYFALQCYYFTSIR